MRLIRTLLCLLLVLCMMLGNGPVAAMAVSEDPQALKDLEDFGAALTEEPEEESQEEVTEVETAEAIPEEKGTDSPQPEEEASEETIPEETAPEETVSAAEKTEEAGVSGHNGIPLFFQTDYPDTMYGIGTIADNGCGAVCLAMVANYLTGHNYRPDELARYFGGAAENNIARMELGSETLQLPFHKAENWHETYAALEAGKVAIALMNGKSAFTNSQHFIVLAGLTEDGKVLVNDPYEPNYEKWDLKQGLRTGFDSSAIVCGYSGAWIYDKDAVPENPFIYYKPAPVRGECRYDFTLTEDEMDLLAKLVWVEARGECMEGQQAVAEVVFNRMASEHFSDDLNYVIFGEGQFPSTKFLEEAQPCQMQYEAIESAFYGPYVLPEDVYYFATSAKTDNVWGQIGGHIFCYAQD